ncbi:hypothetical protein BH23CHL7_BH23CHL7_22180 [soil metagenome]
MNRPQPIRRSWWGTRWRQLRNPPPPVLRAVLGNLLVAGIGGALLLAYSLLDPGADMVLPTGAFVVGVLLAGSLLTYLWVELPTGASGVRRRTGWAALLGLFAAVPIGYLVLVVVFEVIRPLLA